jgi:hypothetical protein
VNQVEAQIVYEPPRKAWRYWPFAVALGVHLFVLFPSVRCRCWYSAVQAIEDRYITLCLGLLLVRHLVAYLRKEETKDWIIYLGLTIALPFIIGTITSIGVSHLH